jgi:hypothetical protein
MAVEDRKQEILDGQARTDALVIGINKRVRERREMRDRIIAMVNDPHTTTSVLMVVDAILGDHAL